MKVSKLNFHASGLKQGEWSKLKKLSTPAKIQDFLNATPFNFEEGGQTHSSPKLTLQNKRAHCFEGALLAAAALWIQWRPPLLLDLKTVRPDFDHVVALFNERGCWGAISKTNHPVLRYRDPVYKSIRELAMSYFHEYFLNSGKKTLRQYSKPFDLSKLGTGWITTEENLATLAHELDISKHFKILTLKQVRNLRKAEGIEIKASNLTEWKRK